MAEIYIYVIDMPIQIHEIVTPCADGYTVYLNARLSQKAQQEAYDHALHHINSNDFEKFDVQEIEGKAHRRKK